MQTTKLSLFSLMLFTACAVEPAQEDVVTEAPITVVPPVARAPAVTPPKVSTRLTVEWRRGGPASVVRAVELPGIVKVETGMKRRYLAVVKLAGEVKSVVPFDADFEERPTGGEESDEIPDATAAETFAVDVPGLGLDQAAALDVQVLEVTGRHDEHTASPEALERLQRGAAVRAVATIDAASVGAFVRSRGRRAPVKAIVDLQ